jgi:streptomycin 6-kinase
MTLDDHLARFRLSSPRRIAETATATVLRVTCADGTFAALKLLRPDEREEARGADYLQALDGHGAVHILARDGPAILMEWCDGPPLGDLSRTGQDATATDIMIDVIQAMHAARIDPCGLEPLANRFAPLTTADLSGDLAAAADLVQPLLDTSPTAVALHGDLHHDNILHGPRGWLAIDPKGAWGDPAYETANAFRNPDGAQTLLFDPARISRLAERFSHRLGQPRRHILGWACAHCALSTFWSRDAGLDLADDLRLLPLLLALHANA